MIFPFYSHDIPIKKMPEFPGHYSLAKQQGHVGMISPSFDHSVAVRVPIWGWVKTLVPLVNPKIAGIYGCE